MFPLRRLDILLPEVYDGRRPYLESGKKPHSGRAHVAIDPFSGNIFLVGTNQSARVTVYRSVNACRSFPDSSAIDSSNSSDGTPPQFVFFGSGRALLFFVRASKIYMSVSTDQGRSFGRAERISSSVSHVMTSYMDGLSAITINGGQVLLAWLDDREADAYPYTQVSADSGATFQIEKRVSNAISQPGAQSLMGIGACASSQNVYLTFHRQTGNTTPESQYVIRSTDLANSFGQPVKCPRDYTGGGCPFVSAHGGVVLAGSAGRGGGIALCGFDEDLNHKYTQPLTIPQEVYVAANTDFLTDGNKGVLAYDGLRLDGKCSRWLSSFSWADSPYLHSTTGLPTRPNSIGPRIAVDLSRIRLPQPMSSTATISVQTIQGRQIFSGLMKKGERAIALPSSLSASCVFIGVQYEDGTFCSYAPVIIQP